MKRYRQIALFSAINILPTSSIQADKSDMQFGRAEVMKRFTQIVEADVNSKQSANAQANEENSQAKTGDASKTKEGKKPASYFRPSSSYSTQPESDPPRYVRTLSKSGIDAFKDINWLDVGLDHRTRYEFRSNDIRRTDLRLDQPFLLRTRAYVDIKEILDPLRFAVELQDSRRYNGNFPHDDRDFNEFELIQTYAELYFKGGLGENYQKQHLPIRFRAGRMAYEALDQPQRMAQYH